jgi:hypothetical protein
MFQGILCSYTLSRVICKEPGNQKITIFSTDIMQRFPHRQKKERQCKHTVLILMKYKINGM